MKMKKLKGLISGEHAIRLDQLTAILLKKLDETLIEDDSFTAFSRLNWRINKMSHGEYLHPKAYLFNQALEQYERMVSAKNEAIRLLNLVEMFPKEDEAI